jgi:hypothetical protein
MVETIKDRKLIKNHAVSTLFVDYPCKVQHGHIGRTLEDDKPIIEYFKKLRKEQPDYEATNLTSWRTSWEAHLEHHDILSELMMDIIQWHNSHVSHPRNDYVHEQIKQLQDFNLDAEVWYTEYDKGDKADEHHHGHISRTSFVYYLDCQPDGSPLTFVKKAIPQYGLYQSVEEFHLQAYPGMIVFFPSFLHHKVYPTRSKRYVLAGNINDIIYKTPDA